MSLDNVRGERILRPAEAWTRLGCRRSHFYQHYVAGGLVRLLRLGPRARGVPESDIDKIIAELIAEATPTPPRGRGRPRKRLPTPTPPAPTPTTRRV
jgi:predicted DNA-binding transcriptional regulator AlpA